MFLLQNSMVFCYRTLFFCGPPHPLGLSDGVFAPRHQLGAVPCWAWKKLVDVKLLKLLDEAELLGGSAWSIHGKMGGSTMRSNGLIHTKKEIFTRHFTHQMLWAAVCLLQIEIWMQLYGVWAHDLSHVLEGDNIYIYMYIYIYTHTLVTCFFLFNFDLWSFLICFLQQNGI